MQLSMTFNNLSSTSFMISANGYDNALATDPYMLPASTLAADDTQIMAMNNQTPIGEGASTFWCTWYDQTSGARFGVQIIDDGQPFGLGDQPTWQICSDFLGINISDPQNTPVTDWQPSGSNPANLYTWETQIGFSIVATPNATHETLNIVILILNLQSQE